jgi:hypothetical protein
MLVVCVLGCSDSHSILQEVTGRLSGSLVLYQQCARFYSSNAIRRACT